VPALLVDLKGNKQAQCGRGRRMRQTLVDFYRSYRFNMFSEGKYDAAGTVVAKTKPVNLVHHRYQLVNHYPPVAATKARARMPRPPELSHLKVKYVGSRQLGRRAYT